MLVRDIRATWRHSRAACGQSGFRVDIQTRCWADPALGVGKSDWEAGQGPLSGG